MTRRNIFMRGSGDIDKKTAAERSAEKRAVNYQCMEIRLRSVSTVKAVAEAHRAGITNRNGDPITAGALMYKCQWALVDNPDYWRTRIDAYDREKGQAPFSDAEWEQHVIENAIELAKSNFGLAQRLILSDPVRWGKWEHLWRDNPYFEELVLPRLSQAPENTPRDIDYGAG